MAERREPRSSSKKTRTYEVYQKDGTGKYAITPISDTLARSGKLAAYAVNKMRMVEEIGWPDAKRQFKDDHNRPLIVKKDDVIWLLKCKPHCWRLYFYVFENDEEKRIIYVRAVCKKKDEEDPNDALKARRAADEIRPGGSAITPFEFPIG